MEFFALILFFIIGVTLFVIGSIVRAAGKAQQQREMLPPDFFGIQGVPAEHVRRVGSLPAAVLPRRAASEASSSEFLWDEMDDDEEGDLTAAEVVSLETLPAGPVTPRPLPPAAETLEAEVDWEAEHVRFHQRYVDVQPESLAAAQGLLDELRDPAAARRAVLMAEILGPPLSQRR